jgi:hypothetical protein
MPIVDDVEEDKRIWNFTPHGEYIVSSAYRYIMENLVDNTYLHVKGNWTKLWHLKVPQKVKVFLWRVAHGCLPTRYRLQTCGVKCSDHCVMCDRSYEDDWHVFFGCKKLEALWEAAGLWHVIKENPEAADGFVSFFFQLLEQLPHRNAERAIPTEQQSITMTSGASRMRERSSSILMQQSLRNMAAME